MNLYKKTFIIAAAFLMTAIFGSSLNAAPQTKISSQDQDLAFGISINPWGIEWGYGNDYYGGYWGPNGYYYPAYRYYYYPGYNYYYIPPYHYGHYHHHHHHHH